MLLLVGVDVVVIIIIIVVVVVVVVVGIVGIDGVFRVLIGCVVAEQSWPGCRPAVR